MSGLRVVAVVVVVLLALPMLGAAAHDPTPPTAPAGLRVTHASSASLTLAWDASSDPESGVAAYDVYRDSVLVGSTAGTTWRDEGLSAATTYAYLVFALNGEGRHSSPSASLQATTRPAAPADCGQVAHELATDPDGDTARGDDASDLVRASLREDADRLHFHLGAYSLDAAGASPPTRHEVSFRAGAFRWTLSASYDGAAAGPATLTAAPVDGGLPVEVPAEVVAERRCNTLVLSVVKEDMGGPQPGDTLRDMVLRTLEGATTLDAAPDAGATAYVVGTAGQPPVLDAVGDRAVAEAQLLAFTLHATDPDADPVAYEADGLPAGATLDAATGAFSWRPTYAQAGAHPVTFRASANGAHDEETVTLTVADVDTTPTFQPVGERETPEGATLAFRLDAADEDGDALAYSADALPPGATLDPATGVFSWTPAHEAGHDDRVFSVTFTVRDATHAVSRPATLVARDVNRPPVLDGLGEVAAREAEELVLALAATDPDGDAIAYAAAGLPPGASFDPENATFRWTPTHDDAGPHLVRFTATDGALHDEEVATLQVEDVNRAPLLDPLGAQSVAEGGLLVLTLHATDPDGDALSYQALDLPAGARFEPSNRTFWWSPGHAQGGGEPHAPRFEATDGKATTGETVPISVADVDRAPILEPVADVTLHEGAPWTLTLRAADPDGDPVAFALEGTPPEGSAFEAGPTPGQATLRLAPPSGAAGAYPLVVRATAGALSATDGFTVTVLHRAFSTLERADAPERAASPGETVTLRATLRNHAALSETYRIEADATQSAWTATASRSDVTLAPGASLDLAVTLAVPRGSGGAFVHLRATPLADPRSDEILLWRVEVPLTLHVHLDAADVPAYDRPSGVLAVRHLDGTPAASVAVRVSQSARALGDAFSGMLTSSLGGATDANGLWFFDYANDPRARVPGEHALIATAAPLPGGTTTAEVRTTYRMG